MTLSAAEKCRLARLRGELKHTYTVSLSTMSSKPLYVTGTKPMERIRLNMIQKNIYFEIEVSIYNEVFWNQTFNHMLFCAAALVGLVRN